MSPQPPCPSRTNTRRSPWRRRRWFLGGLSVLLVAMVVAVGRAQNFLAASKPVPARYLVVEGWLPDYALEAAVREFREGGYRHVYTIGGPLRRSHGSGAWKDYATGAAATLRSLGLSSNEVTAVAALPTNRNRTYLSTVALHDYCVGSGISLDSVNLVSLGVHSRRSRLCLQRALGKDAKVGVIAVENLDYDPGRWWGYSEGIKEVGGETLAFAYAWLSIDYGN